MKTKHFMKYFDSFNAINEIKEKKGGNKNYNNFVNKL